MRKAAVVSTGAFVAPTIITMDAADAQALTSPPPEPPGPPGSPPSDVGSAPGAVTPRSTTQPPAQARGRGNRATGRTALPRTGADLDRLVVAWLAATGGGAALVLWSADTKAASSEAADSTSKTSPVTGDRPDTLST
jgi:hypothetical protein